MGERPLRVLLVEDNPAEADLVREMLAVGDRETFDVEHVTRLADGLDRLGEMCPDVVLLDFSLPDSLGLATYAKVRAAAPTVPVIILTNLDDDTAAAQAVRAGAQDYLIKRQTTGPLLVRAIRYARERGRFEEALRESEERYAVAARGANDGIWDWDLRRDRVHYSPRWLEMVGSDATATEATIDTWLSRVHEDDLESLRAALERHLVHGTDTFQHEHRLRGARGEVRWMLARGLAVRDAHGKTIRMAGSLTDITARKAAEQQLLHDAFHDALTGLPNRTLFVDRLTLTLEHSRRNSDERLAVLFVDLDRFKNINDSLGHSVGDALLVEVAARLRACLRPGDTVARLGGDEFAVLVTDVRASSDAIRVAERILDALEERFVITGHEVITSASIGIAIGSSSYERAEELVRDADTAMYRAKAAGRACYQVFDEVMHRSVAALLRMEMELRQAVERNDFVMHYQPIVSLATGTIVGFEGLVRWRHPQRGLVLPQSFIAVAEETGLIVPIGWLALAEACRQISEWQLRFPMDPPLYVSVNVSGKLFAQKNMSSKVVDVLESSGLSPRSLRLEITESALMDHAEQAMATLGELRRLGVEFSIDDFGTGYSSLSYLQRFAYDTLKIDRSFIAGIGEKADGDVIVQAIVTLGTLLGMNVVAEGVETSAQLERLQAMRCPQGQGYWFSHPVDGHAAEQLLHHGAIPCQ